MVNDHLKVFKFGGASVRHADAIRQVANIVKDHRGEKLLIVVSAMGKTTNALEQVATGIFQKKDYLKELQKIRAYHDEVMQGLFRQGHPVFEKINEAFEKVGRAMKPGMTFDKLYDQVVSAGELLSSTVVSHSLQEAGIEVEWIDARDFIVTDDTYREGKVDWDNTEAKMKKLLPVLEKKIVLTQGFIGRSPDGSTTTLGREGSDYSAAIYASCLGASSVTIWKDVPGVMNADPKRLKDAKVFEELPFKEAAEMTYYGASVIHPKTIKPLANRNIPLLVKNFDDPSLPGTVIHEAKVGQLPPLIVFKDNQCLISCRVTDYTFVNEQQLSYIFHALSEHNIHINLMQNSAISFSFCIDFREDKVLALIEVLAKQFEVYYNTGLTLITIKNYDEKTYDEYRRRSGIVLEQTSRSTMQLLLRVE